MYKSECTFISWLSSRVRAAGAVPLGIGDDAAIVKVTRGRELLLASDLSVEGIHYLQHVNPPDSVGHKGLVRPLSDIGAMGGVPRFVLVSLAVTSAATIAWVRGFYAGLLRLAQQFETTLVGGDTAQAKLGFADVTVAGEVEARRAITRSGARPGDQIFVSGFLGLSALGLQLLNGYRTARKARRALTAPNLPEPLRAHLYPEPRIALGRFLADRRLASSGIDLSDGLSSDLHRLCAASSVGARLWADSIPRPDRKLAEDQDGLELALNGGEDYELLFTVRPAQVRHVPLIYNGTPLTRIGEITAAKEIVLIQRSGKAGRLKPKGYDHFDGRRSR